MEEVEMEEVEVVEQVVLAMGEGGVEPRRVGEEDEEELGVDEVAEEGT